MNPQTPNQPGSPPPAPSVPQRPEAPLPPPNSAGSQTAPTFGTTHFSAFEDEPNLAAPAAPATAPPVSYAQAVVSDSSAPPPKAAAKPKGPQTNPNSTQNTLQIAEIRDGIVIMNDGSFRSVVMVKSINFDLMSPQEQEAVEYSYQSFLNSLYFPVQIFVRSQKVDLMPYIEKLDKIRTEHDNMLLALLMEDYIGYIDALSQQTNIMDKKFYVVIPYFPVVDEEKAYTQSKNFFSGLVAMFTSSKEQHIRINEDELENAKTELRNRVQAVLAGLLQASIQGLPLDTQELIELYYDTYNPDTATRQALKNFETMNADMITKGQGVALQNHLRRELQ